MAIIVMVIMAWKKVAAETYFKRLQILNKYCFVFLASIMHA